MLPCGTHTLDSGWLTASGEPETTSLNSSAETNAFDEFLQKFGDCNV